MTVLYQVFFKIHGASTFIQFGTPTPAVSIAVTGLSPITSYDFFVQASNAFGSASSTVVVASTTNVSGQPPPGSVAGSQNTGAVDPVLAGPALGSVLKQGVLPVAGLTVTDVVSSTTTTWNPNDKSTGYVLSNGNQTAVSGAADPGTGGEGIRSTTSKTAGKVYFEIQIGGTLGGNYAIGIATAAFILGSGGELGGDSDGMGWYPITGVTSQPQSAYINNSTLTTGSVQDVFGAFINFALDITNKLIWISGPAMRAAGFPWNNSTTANPATGVGGLSLATLSAAPWFICASNTDPTALANIRVDSTGFNNTIPVGFTAWDGPSTLTVTCTTGTVSITSSGVVGNGTVSLSLTGTLAVIQAAIATLSYTAPNLVTSANVVVRVVDRSGASNSLTIPISISAAVIPAPPTSLVVT